MAFRGWSGGGVVSSNLADAFQPFPSTACTVCQPVPSTGAANDAEKVPEELMILVAMTWPSYLMVTREFGLKYVPVTPACAPPTPLAGLMTTVGTLKCAVMAVSAFRVTVLALAVLPFSQWSKN